MNSAVLIIGAVLTAVVLVDLVVEFRRGRLFEPDRQKERRLHNSLMKTKKVPSERNPFLLPVKQCLTTQKEENSLQELEGAADTDPVCRDDELRNGMEGAPSGSLPYHVRHC